MLARSLGLALSLGALGCSTLHPFSDMPGSSGKLDLTPRVLIVRGQAPEVCRWDEKPFELLYFIHLQHMPEQALWVEDVKKGELKLWGSHFTLRVKTHGYSGKMSYVETKFRTAEKSFSLTTIVMDCKGVIAAPKGI